tara:strand:- start:3265 stop:3606 length:342 start_codon:yes stop_codon:yes gene_type:complete
MPFVASCGLPEPIVDLTDPNIKTFQEDVEQCRFYAENGGHDVLKTTLSYIGGGAAFSGATVAASPGDTGDLAGLVIIVAVLAGVAGYASSNGKNRELFINCVTEDHKVKGWKG